MNLIINTADPAKITVGLSKNSRLLSTYSVKARRGRKESLLKVIDSLLVRAKSKLKDIRGIIVVTGPGSFTGLRVGIVIANTLGHTLDIPVFGIKLKDFRDLGEIALRGDGWVKEVRKRKRNGKPVLPFYGKEPNIT